MSLNRYAKARDENEPDIIGAIKAHGVSVERLDRPLDLLCGFNGLTRLAEVKRPRNKRGDPEGYTKAQVKFLGTWKGGHTLLVTVDDATEFAVKLKLDSLRLAESEVA